MSSVFLCFWLGVIVPCCTAFLLLALKTNCAGNIPHFNFQSIVKACSHCPQILNNFETIFRYISAYVFTWKEGKYLSNNNRLLLLLTFSNVKCVMIHCKLDAKQTEPDREVTENKMSAYLSHFLLGSFFF